MLGMGTIKNKQPQGKSRARKYSHPQNRMTKPASKKINDERARKSSAPSTPATSMTREKMTIPSPAHDGFSRRRANWRRRFHTTRAENKGTREPCPKLGSLTHCRMRPANVGP